ncbi:MAG: hypothetical protein RJB13_1170 [Pseudomonadota bacterium]|jgi:riboflavin synthase
MFTGLIRDVGTVVEWARSGSSAKMSIETHLPETDLALGASVACNGVCLTVVSQKLNSSRNSFAAEIGPETLALTQFGIDSFSGQGARINLEPAIRMGEAFGGHVLTGHVDTLATVIENSSCGEGFWKFKLQFDPSFGRFLVKKGSIGVAGVSLTIADCDRSAGWVEIMLIPHTLQQTNLREFTEGSCIEVEFDSQAKMVAEMLENMLPQHLKTIFQEKN